MKRHLGPGLLVGALLAGAPVSAAVRTPGSGAKRVDCSERAEPQASPLDGAQEVSVDAWLPIWLPEGAAPTLEARGEEGWRTVRADLLVAPEGNAWQRWGLLQPERALAADADHRVRLGDEVVLRFRTGRGAAGAPTPWTEPLATRRVLVHLRGLDVAEVQAPDGALVAAWLPTPGAVRTEAPDRPPDLLVTPGTERRLAVGGPVGAVLPTPLGTWACGDPGPGPREAGLPSDELDRIWLAPVTSEGRWAAPRFVRLPVELPLGEREDGSFDRLSSSALQAAGPGRLAAWAHPEDVEALVSDLTGDSTPDRLEIGREDHSGGTSSRWCVEDSATGAITCWDVARGDEASWLGIRPLAGGSAEDVARLLLGERCAAADPKAPGQAPLWSPDRAAVPSGTLPQPVCIPGRLALRHPWAWTWRDGGTPTRREAKEWTVLVPRELAPHPWSVPRDPMRSWE